MSPAYRFNSDRSTRGRKYVGSPVSSSKSCEPRSSYPNHGRTRGGDSSRHARTTSRSSQNPAWSSTETISPRVLPDTAPSVDMRRASDAADEHRPEEHFDPATGG